MSSSQKFIARNRAPRVQIEYDVELYGAEKKVQLPFVMGVMADLAGKTAQPAVNDRKFLEIDVDNFDERMRALAPSAQFSVPNTLTGDGNLAVELTFERMSDFSPQAIAARVGALRPLLEARQQLDQLMAYMDGKAGAETLIETLLSDTALLSVLAGPAAQGADVDRALASLRAKHPDAGPASDPRASVLSNLAQQGLPDAPAGPTAEDILGAVEPRDLPAPPNADAAQDVALDGLRGAEPAAEAAGPSTEDVLASIEAVENVGQAGSEGAAAATLDALREADMRNEAIGPATEDVLGSVSAAPERAPPGNGDAQETALESLRDIDVSDAAGGPTTDDILSGIEATSAPDPAVDDTSDQDTLAALREADVAAEPSGPSAEDILNEIDAPPVPEPEAPPSAATATLGALRETEVPDAPKGPSAEDILSGIDAPAVSASDMPADAAAETLGALRGTEVPDAPRGPTTEDVLSGIEATPGGGLGDGRDGTRSAADAALSALREAEVSEAATGPTSDDVLAGLEAPEAPQHTEPDRAQDRALEALRDAKPTEPKPTEPKPEETSSTVLEGLSEMAPAEEDTADDAADVLVGLAARPPRDVEPQEDAISDILSGLPETEDDTPAADDIGDVLVGLEAPSGASDDKDASVDIDDILGTLDAPPEKSEDGASIAQVIAGLEASADMPAREREHAKVAHDTVDAVEEPDVSATAQSAPTFPKEAAPEIDDALGAREDHLIAYDQVDSFPDGQAPDVAREAARLSDDELSDDELSDDELSDDELSDDELSDDELSDELDDLLGGLEEDEVSETSAPGTETEPTDVAAVRAEGTEEDVSSDLDDLMAGLGDEVAEVANDPEEDLSEEDRAAGEVASDLDDLLAGNDETEAGPAAMGSEDSDLDYLPSDLDDDASRVDGIAGAQTASDAVEPERSDGAVPDTQRFAGSNAPAAEEPILSEDDQADDLVSDLDDLLADLEEPDEKAVSEASSVDTPQAVTAGAQITAPNGAVSEGNGAADDMMSELDDLLADLDAPDEAEADARSVGDAGVGTRDLGPSDADQVLADDPTDDLMSDLDELLADLDAPDEQREDALAAGADGLTAELDDLLADLEDDTDTASRSAPPEKAEPAAVPSKPPARVAEDVDADGLDDLLEEADMARDAPKAQAVAGFGTVGAARFDRTALNRKSFRIAVFGDFTGRSSRGVIEPGEALATRPAIPLDVDDIEEMIEGFATTLTLPIGKDRAGIEVKLGELDDLHPDELFDSVEIFQELSGLRQQLDMGSMASQAVERLKDWGATYGTPVRVPKRSASTAVPADRKLSDFQALIGNTEARLVQPSPVEEMIARIVGPYAVKAPDAGVDAMKAAVDEALSAAMRLILHHPDFQAVEAQWRTLDLLARRIETGADLELVLYDVSAEELAVDLSAGEDLAQSGFLRLLTSVLDPEIGPGGFSALVGLYTFEETPPHAELLGRIAQVAAHVDAPFLTALSPAYLETAKTDRHPLVAQAWERLRGLPEASYVALASPRFMLRLPYGKTSERISTFKFEEFTPQEGLSGMLWANPAALVAILLAQTYTQAGTVDAMALGSVMSLDDVPFFYMTDGFGDQVALPCTERNLTADMAQSTLLRGVMPVLSIKGRNEIRLGSFRAVSGQELAGRWSDAQAAPTGKGTAPTLEFEVDFPTEAAESAAARGAEGSSLGAEASSNAADDDMSLDDLLASFGDDTDDDGGDDDDMDPELAELLKGL